MDIKLDIIKQHNNYMVVRIGGAYHQHAHLSTYKGCQTLLRCIRDNKMPYSSYLMGSCRRLLSDTEYGQLRERKQMYYNSQKGIRR
ncbi:hypothetical protein [Parasporobacterium paucivorans]|uniref:Uncharacterized protein n=1 Tax=Parasporobacterium paucivorans DSM 15970 TaxID=1122934 RepID=A0A1M6B366_9FIRM|nr:hypothetical protein [Parasporobacterium paucivorans]SHI43189.1 hypothetical protein SAMN02745691_00248 [Parasporobacterium paucivorans DSM 15970]